MEAVSALLTKHLSLKTAQALSPPPQFKRGQLPISVGYFHEWFSQTVVSGCHVWHPPLTVMAGLAGRIIGLEGNKHIVWIGRRCWPTFQLLQGIGASHWLSRSIFLDPCNDDERFWSIGQALRCPGVALVIADGCEMSQTVSRRLQLAAESGTALAFIARPSWESDELSYAETRWQVRPLAGDEVPGWNIALFRCRRQQHGQDARQDWTATWAYQAFRGTGTFDLFPGLGCGAGSSSVERAPAFSQTA
jgi:hypothetical protein